jgi:hypothetical protein
MNIVVKIIPTDHAKPLGKLADAELHFTTGELDGLKLIGFSVWKGRGGKAPSVLFPMRQYRVGNEHRTYALLRPIADVSAHDRVRDMVLEAYAQFERETVGSAPIQEGN